MSGPKTSRYRVSEARRRQLEIQRENELTRARCRSTIQRATEKISGYVAGLSHGVDIAKELSCLIGHDGGFECKKQELEDLVARAREMAKSSGTENISELKKCEKDVSDILRLAETKVRELAVIISDNEQALQRELSVKIDAGFEVSVGELKKKAPAALSVEIETYLNDLEVLRHSSVLTSEDMKEVDGAIVQISELSDPRFLKNYIALTIVPLIKRCRKTIEDHEKYKDEFDELYSEYAFLCEKCYLIPQQYLCNAESIATLKKEIARIQQIIAYDEEQEYIGECIEEIMSEMGYDMLGVKDVTKKSGKTLHSELYSYSEGTVVNVTFGANGTIVMELGGLDDHDRLPTHEESRSLCDSMQSFCGTYAEIERKLEERGIVGEHISLLPPTVEHAQIINVSEFGTEKSDGNSKSEKRKKKRTVKKTIRVD